MRRLPSRLPRLRRIPSPQYELRKPEELDIPAFYTQRQTMQEWLFASVSTYRSPATLSTLHRHILIHGLSSLQKRIADLVNLDLQLYHKYCSLLTDEEVAEQTYGYTGFPWNATLDRELQLMNREHLQWLLWEDTKLYGRISSSVRRWKCMVDGKIRRMRHE